MSKTKKILKWSFIVLLSLIVSIVSFGYWFISLLPKPEVTKAELKTSLPSELPYLTENIIEPRGKILAVVTSADTMGSSGKSTGYELTELARAYYVFHINYHDRFKFIINHIITIGLRSPYSTRNIVYAV